MNKAFAVYHDDFEMVAIYMATSRGKAHAAAFNAAKGAGYESKWLEFRVKRAKRFDSLAQPGCYAEGWLERNYDMWGDPVGYSASGCLDKPEFRRHPREVYRELSQ